MPFSPATSKVASGTTTARATTASDRFKADAADAGGAAGPWSARRPRKNGCSAFAGDEDDLIAGRWSSVGVDQRVALLNA